MKFILAIVFIGFFGAGSSYAQSEYKMYAGFIYNFTRYIQWPANKSTGDFVIGYVGGSEIAAPLNELAATKNVNGRKIVVKKIAAPAEASACHVVFFSKTASASVASFKTAMKSGSALVITEHAGMTDKGSIINFIQEEGKVKFELKDSEALAYGLKVSADLKKLAILK